jgi:hypothetical protein
MAKKKKVQKDKQRSTKHTHKSKDQVTRTPLSYFSNIAIQEISYDICACERVCVCMVVLGRRISIVSQFNVKNRKHFVLYIFVTERYTVTK